MTYKYRAYRTRNTSGPANHFNDRDELIQFFATQQRDPIKIYSQLNSGLLGSGDTLDGFRREIALARENLRLRNEIAELKKQISKQS